MKLVAKTWPKGFLTYHFEYDLGPAIKSRSSFSCCVSGLAWVMANNRLMLALQQCVVRGKLIRSYHPVLLSLDLNIDWARDRVCAGHVDKF
jgi:hypothetical protein